MEALREGPPTPSWYPRAIAILVVACGLVLPPRPAFAGDAAPLRTPLSGLVTDTSGQALDRALVLLTPLAVMAPVQAALTDSAGRYAVSGLLPGRYRITALKAGYSAAVGKITSGVEQGLNLVLRPLDGLTSPNPVPTWVMTAPPRDILRDADITPAGPDRAGTGDAGAAGTDAGIGVAGPLADRGGDAVADFLSSLSGELSQSYGESEPPSGSDRLIQDGRGLLTRLRLGSAIGERAEWDLVGRRESWTTPHGDEGLDPPALTEQSLGAGFRYRLGRSGTLAMRAFYDHDARDFSRSVDAPVASAEIDNERRGWGYDATWTGGVGGGAHLDVGMRYQGTTVGPSGRSSERIAETVGESGVAANDQARAFRTSARVSRSVGSDHRIGIGVRARVYSLGAWEGRLIAPSASQDPSLYSALGNDGWTLSVDAVESWMVGPELSVDFGLGLSHSSHSEARRLEALVPQAGVTFTPTEMTEVRGLITYAVSHDETAQGATQEEIDHRPLGFQLRVEQRLGSLVGIVLDAQVRSLFYDFIGGAEEQAVPPPGEPLYLSDASSRLRELGLRIETRALPAVALSLGAGVGHVDGRFAVWGPEDLFVRALSEGDLRFVRGRLLGSVERSGTLLLVDLARVEGEGGGADAYADRRLELGLDQTLAFLRAGRSVWSAHLRYQSFIPEDGNDPMDDVHTGRWPVASLERITGGIAVAF